MNDTRTISERLASARPRDDGIERRRLRAELGTRLLGETGRTQIDRYVLLRPIGTGAMGVVYAAHDPALDRSVAIKVLDAATQRDPDRLLSEAQALAKLSDPHVVPVYDVGSVDDRVWIAMELVEGGTLRAWLRAAPRTWSEVLAVMLDAGRGLAGAHAAGLVHRDFKPENVMVGDDGRVRVMDFGLARPVAIAAVDEGATTVPRARAATAGAGTPAYMAAEQFERRPADARTDQFAYCVTFWEALFGQHPFRVELGDLAAEVRSGRVRTPPPDAAVPKWLSAIVRRGLAPVASDRWRDMASLLHALERGRSRARARRGVAWLGAALLAAGAVAGVQQLERHHRQRVCEDGGAVVAEFWDADARERLIAGLRATEVPHADGTAHAVAERLDDQAERWRDARVHACLEHDARPDRLDRALWCLDDRRFELEALVRTLTNADRETANRSLFAASRLSDIARCRDAAVLDRLPVIPEARREQIRSLRERIAGVVAKFATGSHAEGLPVAREVVDEAEAIGWPPLVAHARVVEASFLRVSAAYDEATESAMTAYFEAVRIPDWDNAADAAIVLLSIAAERDDAVLGRQWARHAEVALAHADDTAGLRAAGLFGSVGVMHVAAGEYAEGRRAHQRSRDILVDLFGEDHSEASTPLLNLAVVDYQTGDYARARSTIERVIEIRERALGPDHPDLAVALKNLATVLERMRVGDEARALMLRALAIEERSYGADHPRVAVTLNNLAIVYRREGDDERARALHERALAIRQERLGPDHPLVATSLDNLAAVYDGRGDRATAIELHEQALVVRERALGPTHLDVADTLNNLGVMVSREGDRVRARALLDRALAIREAALGPSHPDVAVCLTNLAALEEDEARLLELYRRVLAIRDAALGPDHPEVARALTNLALAQQLDERGTVDLLERAVGIFDRHEGVQPREAAARFGLARALVATDGDPKRARALGEAALRAHRGDGNAEEAARVEQWLTSRF